MKTIKFYGHKNIIFPLLGPIKEGRRHSQQMLATKMQILGVDIDQQAISKTKNDKIGVTDFELVCICKIVNIKAEHLAAKFWSKIE